MQNEMPKWRQEVEEILGKKFPDSKETALAQEMPSRLLELLKEVTLLPSGEEGALIIKMLMEAALELSPISATFAGFTVGVIYSRYQHEREV